MTDPVARGWDEAAIGYESYFVPRFAPWVHACVDAVTAAAIPDGPILVPCCGTFPEAEPLVERLPDREIVGIDLSAGMVNLANERLAHVPNVRAVPGDASAVDPQWQGQCGAVLSVFGLQQMPNPEAAIRAWARALRRSGVLSVIFWPDRTEVDGPFALLHDIVRARMSPGDSSWEDRLVAALTAVGAVVERDEQPSFPMSHAGAAQFFDAFVDCGPMRSLAIRRGDDFVTKIRSEFLAGAPNGPWSHEPHARHIVARRH